MHPCTVANCGRQFRLQCEMRAHQLVIHLGLKPFKCLWPSCGKRFAFRNETLANVRFAHLGIALKTPADVVELDLPQQSVGRHRSIRLVDSLKATPHTRRHQLATPKIARIKHWIMLMHNRLSNFRPIKGYNLRIRSPTVSFISRAHDGQLLN